MAELAYYDIVGSEQKRIWNQYRIEDLHHSDAQIDLVRSWGAEKFVPGFDGGVVAIVPKDRESLPDGFSTKPNAHGAHFIKGGRTKVSKESSAARKSESDAVAALKPSISELATREGFLGSYSYEDKDGYRGSGSVGRLTLEQFHALWFDPTGPIVLAVPDFASFIRDAVAENPNYTYANADWTTPDGYARISKEEWDFRVADFRLRKANAEAA